MALTKTRTFLTDDGTTLQVADVLGEGGFGIVMRCISPEDGVVKITNSPRDDSLEKEARCYRELSGSDMLPKFFSGGKIIEKGLKYDYILMEYFTTDLNEYLSHFEVDDMEMDSICRSVIEALKHCHEHGWSHGDIKAENVLVNYTLTGNGSKRKDVRFVLTDFGLARRFRDDNGVHIPYEEDEDRYGTPRYMSIDSERGVINSARSDMQSLGYSLICWYGGSLPWDNKGWRETANMKEYMFFFGSVKEFLTECFPEGCEAQIKFAKVKKEFIDVDHFKITSYMSAMEARFAKIEAYMLEMRETTTFFGELTYHVPPRYEKLLEIFVYDVDMDDVD